jgi:serine phosphatase RsbU (regulator of sigma subunit)
MVYGEVHPNGSFRFANFGHPPPLVFSAKCSRLLKVDEGQMAQFFALGLELPADHPDHQKYFTMNLREGLFTSSDVAEIKLINPGDILVLYSDGVYDGSDDQARELLEAVLRRHQQESAKDICNALMDHAISQDELLRLSGDEALIDDKTVLIVKRT